MEILVTYTFWKHPAFVVEVMIFVFKKFQLKSVQMTEAY